MTLLEQQLAQVLEKAMCIVGDRAAGGRMQSSRSYAEEIFEEAKAVIAEYDRQRDRELNTVRY